MSAKALIPVPKAFALSCMAAALVATLVSGGRVQAAVPLAAPADPVLAPVREAAAADGGLLTAVRIDVARLRAASPGQRFGFALPDGRVQQVVFDAVIERADASQWIGHAIEGRQFAVVLRLHEGLATGVLRTPSGAYVLGYADGVQWLGADLSPAAQAQAYADLPPMLRADGALAETDDPGSSSRGTGIGGTGKPADAAHPVQLDLVAMSQLEPGADMQLSIPEHGDYRVTYEHTAAGDADTSTWVGHLKDYGQDFRVIVTSGPQGSVGTILTPSGEILLVNSGGRQWLVDTVRSGLSQFEPDHADAIGEPLQAQTAGGGMAEGVSTGLGTATAGATAGAGATGAANSLSTTIIDVLVLYTAGFKSRNGSTWSTRIAQLAAMANQAYLDSGVDMKIRIVATQQVSLADTTSNSTTLSQLAAGSGAFSGVPALRKKYGADLVTLIRPFYMNAQGGNCGVGYIGGYNGTNIAYYGSYGYSVVSDGRDVAGTGYYCTDYTLTHELGHNMGLMHDRSTVTRQGGGQGAYPYAFGYGHSNSFGTIMSYIFPVVGKFSNPTLNTCGGSNACGVAVSDSQSAYNALALTNTKAAVSNFTASVVPTTVQVSGTVSKAGKGLGGVGFVVSGGGTCTATGSNGAFSCTLPYGWSGSIVPQVVGKATPAVVNLSALKAASTKRNFTVR